MLETSTRDLSQAGLEVLCRFVLHAAVLDRCSVVVSAILTGDIARGVERASGLELISKPPLNVQPLPGSS